MTRYPTLARAAHTLLPLTLAALVPFIATACTKEAPPRHSSAQRAAKEPPKTAPQTKSQTPAATTGSARERRVRSHNWATRGPLAPVMKVSASLLDAAKRALIQKPQVEDPFAPLTGKISHGLREALLKTNPKSLRLMGLEFELVFYDGDESKVKAGKAKATFYLRTFLHPGENGPEFFKIAGRIPKGGKVNVPSLPLDAYQGDAAPFAQAARGLAKLLEAGHCNMLPIVATEPLTKILAPGPRTVRMLANLRRAGLGKNRLCASLSSIKLGHYHLRLDDVSFAVLGKDGHITGMVNAELRIKDEKIFLDLKSYRSTIF